MAQKHSQRKSITQTARTTGARANRSPKGPKPPPGGPKAPGLLRQTPGAKPGPGAIPKVATFKVTQCQAAAYNRRAITEKALEGLRSSIQEFGSVAPIWRSEKRDFDAVVRAGEKARARQARSA